MALREWARPLIDWLQRGKDTSEGGVLARLFVASALPLVTLADQLSSV